MRILAEKNIIYISLILTIIAAPFLRYFPFLGFSFTGYFKYPLLDYAIVCIFLFILSLTTTYLLLKSKSSFINSLKLTQFLSALLACFFLFVITKVDWTYYHKWAPYKAAIYKEYLTYFLALIPFAAILSYFYLNKSIKVRINYFCIAAIGLLCAYMSYFLIFNELHIYNENTINFQAVLFPLVQQALGKAVHINQMSHYGGYTYFFEPFLKLTGLTILSVSSMFAFVMLSTLSLIAYALYQIVENKVLLVFGFIAYLFFHFFWATLWPHELYLQYYPLRTIFPAIALFLIGYYLKKPSLKFFIGSISVLTLGVIWSLDVGSFALAVFIAAKMFHILCNGELSGKEKIKKITFYLTCAILTIISTLTLFAFYTKYRYGTFIDFSRMDILMSHYTPDPGVWYFRHAPIGGDWITIRDGVEYGFYQHTYVFGFISYLAAIAYSCFNLLKQNKTYKNTIIFFIATLGLGILTYQINNKNTQIFAQCGYPFVLLCIIFADSSLRSIQEKNFSTYGYKFFSIATILLISFSSVVYYQNIKRHHITREYSEIHEFYPPRESRNPLWSTMGDHGPKGTKYVTMKDIANGNPDNLRPPWLHRSDDLQNFFKDQKEDIKGKKIVILTMWDGYLHLKLGVPSALPFPNAYHTMWGHGFGKFKGWSRHDIEGVSSEERMFKRIKEQDFDWFIMDTAGTLMNAHHGHYMRVIRMLLKESGYTLHVIPTAPTYHTQWSENIFLAYTKKQTGSCKITSDENEGEGLKIPVFQVSTLTVQTECKDDKEK